MSQLHDSTAGAHLGIGKTMYKVRERFFWYAVRRDVEEWCVSCEICCSRKMSHRRAWAPMKQYNVGLPMERIAIDFMGPLPRTNAPPGITPKRYLMVVGDYFTKWTEAIPLENIEAKTVARALIDNFISRFGVPLLRHTDQGATFESQLFQEMCQILGIKKTRTTKARPQSDGMIERANRTILNMLSAFVSEHQRDWDEIIEYRCGICEDLTFKPRNACYNHLREKHSGISGSARSVTRYSDGIPTPTSAGPERKIFSYSQQPLAPAEMRQPENWNVFIQGPIIP